MDVSYWLNRTAEERLGRGRFCTINASVEESTLADRDDSLLEQDAFLRDAVGPGDVVVLSLGGNDIALRPTKTTILSILALTRSPAWAIKAGIAPGFGHFVVRPRARPNPFRGAGTPSEYRLWCRMCTRSSPTTKRLGSLGRNASRTQRVGSTLEGLPRCKPAPEVE